MPAGTSWDVHAAQVDVTGTSPVVRTGVVQSNFHHGVICTGGTSCSTDGRKLLDFFDMQLDAAGQLLVVYTRDQSGTKTEIAFSRQSSGCVLTAPCVVGGELPEFPLQALPVLAGAAVGALVLVRRRRRQAPALPV
jgi:hypothetical protein